MPTQDQTIYYDRDCGFCRYLLATVLRWDRSRDNRLVPVALQDLAVDVSLSGMPLEQRMASWHLVSAEGEIVSAGAAMPEVLDLVHRHRLTAAALRRFPVAAERGYRWVAEHRTGLGKMTRRWSALRGKPYPPVITDGDGDAVGCAIQDRSS